MLISYKICISVYKAGSYAEKQNKTKKRNTGLKGVYSRAQTKFIKSQLFFKSLEECHK